MKNQRIGLEYVKIVERLFLIVIAILFTTNIINAQSKKELAQMAKIQAEIDATTTADGLRAFQNRSKYMRYYIKRCYHLDNDVIIEILVENNSTNDEYIKFQGKNSEDKYTTGARDNKGRFYNSDNFLFTTGNTNEFKDGNYETFVPAEGALKIKLKIVDVDSDVSKFKELYFGYAAKYEGGKFTLTAKIKELLITEY